MNLSRRSFLINAGYTLFLAAAAGIAAMLARFLTPNIVTPSQGPVEIGAPEEYMSGSLTFVQNAHTYLGRDEHGIYAITATCTHLGCMPRLQEDGFACPCHGSLFSRDGDVVNGPATRALARAWVGRASSGKLLVDPGRIVDVNYRLKI